MPLNIPSEEVNRLADKLGSGIHKTKTDSSKLALENELYCLEECIPLRECPRPLQALVMSAPAPELQADKEFFDKLSGDI